MRRLFFGGSFNPIHHAHLICARAVAEKEGFDRVVLVPSANPPHKPGHAELAPAEARLDMCRLAAAAGGEMFEVEDIEVRRGGRSYTLQTVQELKARGIAEVNWLIGADMLMYLPEWHEALRLIEETRFVVMARPGWEMDWQKLPAEYRALKARVVEAPLLEISATGIRRRIAEGRSIDFLTPPAVVEYIRRNDLYRF